jgi:serine/threonine-protein kinase PknK
VCSSDLVPGLLMESIFFGHVRGAFTGAVRNAPGLFRQAHRGVLFLDEVAELGLALQAKLLRVLEDGIIRPVGGDREHRVDVRLITATSRDLRRAVLEGDFREELYYRTNVLEIRLPPLRERAADIPILVDSLLRKHSPGGEPRMRFTPDALEFLQTLPWRGNVRELDNLVQRALILCPTPSGGVEEVRRLVSEPLEVGVKGPGADRLFNPGPPAADRGRPEPLSVVRPLEEERRDILDALRRARGNKSEVARLLGLHRNALLRRMRRLGIEM